LTRAIELIERIAVAINKSEVAGNPLEGINSTELVRELLQLQGTVVPEGGQLPLKGYYRLAEFHAALGQHREALEVINWLLAEQRSRVGNRHVEIAKLLRMKAASFEAMDEPSEGSAARQEALAILADLLGKPDVVHVLAGIVADEMQLRTAGGGVTPEAWAGTEVAKATGKEPSPKRGDIWWVEFPQYPKDPHQPRPAVVVSVDHRNDRADKVQVVPLSSNNNGHRMNFAIPKDKSGLQYDSCAKCGDITAVAKTMLRGPAPIGQVNKQLVDGIVELAQQALLVQ
jgi:mRNA-degrading endonuclease toxin of MazEF toxin-antitoxin module